MIGLLDSGKGMDWDRRSDDHGRARSRCGVVVCLLPGRAGKDEFGGLAVVEDSREGDEATLIDQEGFHFAIAG
jgi:hypothetical protein